MNTNRICFGLMPVLAAVLELPRTVLPLKSVRYRFVARAGVAEVEMTQVYRQENPEPLDCEYLFPLPADGAVYRCEASIDGRVLCARIEERAEARRIATQRKAEGRRTALVESERDNLFTLSLGNVQPGDLVEVKLAYLQPLRRLGSQVTLDLPLCPGVRYIPGRNLLRANRGSGFVDDTDQVPDASRITPPRIDGEHPDAAFVELDGQVEAAFLEGSVTSPSHSLTGTSQGEMSHVTLARGGEIPDRDLALRWNERAPQQTALRGWTTQNGDHQYALLELRAPDHLKPSAVAGQDVYFLMDRSCSMDGLKWHKAARALHGCVEVLNPMDRVSVTLFGSTFRDFDAEPLAPEALMADPRFLQLPCIGDMGGTEMAPALRHVLDLVDKHSKGRPAVLILITDAEIGNEQEIVTLMGGHPNLPVHCFGIDTTLNDSLLLDLVRQQGGTFHALHPGDDVLGIITQLGCTLRQPVLINLQVPEGWELAASAIPNLYAGQIRFVSLRSRTVQRTEELTMLAGNHDNQPARLPFRLRPVEEAGPRLLWCKERLLTLVTNDKRSAAITLSKESNLLCPLTAFVAWDEQEKVAVASHRLVQPAIRASLESVPRVSRMVGFVGRLKEVEEPTERFARMTSAPFLRYAEGAPGAPSSDVAALDPLNRLIERNGEFMRAWQAVFTTKEYQEPIRSLMAWVRHHANPESIGLVHRLLDLCETILNDSAQPEESRKKLILERIEAFLREHDQAGAPPRAT